jgi:hypothetical protein
MKFLPLKLSMFTALVLISSACGTDTDSDLSAESPFANKYLHEMTFLSAHNSFMNTVEGGKAVAIAANQGDTSTEAQLREGVRAFMIDLHEKDGQAKICHNLCELPLSEALKRPKDYALSKISGEQSTEVFLKKIKKFLDDNRGEIVTIQIEDYVNNGLLRTELDKVQGLRGLMFNPYAENVREKGWPKVGQMIASNKRLLILSNRSDKKDLGVGFDQDFTVENYWSMSKAIVLTDAECKTRWDHIPLDKSEARFQRLFVMNHFRDIPLTGKLSNDNKYNTLRDRVTKQCMPKTKGRKPNFLAVDYATNGDARRVVEDLNAGRIK